MMNTNSVQQDIKIKEEQDDMKLNQKSKHCTIDNDITKRHSVSKDYSTTRNKIENSQVNLSQGQTTTLLVQRNLELRLSNNSQTKVRSILNDVHQLTDKEKLLLYLKLPTKDNYSEDECHLIPLSNTRQEQTQAFQWIQSNLEETDSSFNLPKHEVYDDYKAYCDTLYINRTLSAPDFGKIIKCVFPTVKARRLGTRGNSKYCYSGLRKKLVKETSSPQGECPASNAEVNNNDGTVNKDTNNQNHILMSACTLVCEWANKLLGRVFSSVIELARFLVGGSYVSTKSMAAFVVMSATEDQKQNETRLSVQSPMSRISIRKDATPSPAILRSNSTDISIDSTATSPLTPSSENASSPASSVDSRPPSSLSNNSSLLIENKPKQVEDKVAETELRKNATLPMSLSVARTLTPSQLIPLPLTIQCSSKRDMSPTVLMSPVFATPLGTPSRKIPITTTGVITQNEVMIENSHALPQSPLQRQSHTTRSPLTLKRADSSPYPMKSPRQARHNSTARNQTSVVNSSKSPGRNKGDKINQLSTSLPIWPAQAVAAFVNHGTPLPESSIAQQYQLPEMPLQASPVSLTNKPPILQRHHSMPDSLSLQHFPLFNDIGQQHLSQSPIHEQKTSDVTMPTNQTINSPIKNAVMLRNVRDKVLNVGQFNSIDRQQPAKRNLLQYFENGTQPNSHEYQQLTNINDTFTTHQINNNINNQNNNSNDDGLFNILCDLPTTNADIGSLTELMDEQTEELLDSLTADHLWNNEWNTSNVITAMMETT